MLKAAVIGCGRMGVQDSRRFEGAVPAGWLPISHAQCLRQVAGVNLAALADVDEGRLTTAGAQYGVDALYRDHRALLRDVSPDILAVATRTPGKAQIVADACAAGVRAVYVEKPLANSLLACSEAIAAAAAKQTVLGYGVTRRYHAVYRHAVQLLRAGVIGSLQDICVEFGRSQLLWTHPHSVDLMLLFAQARPVMVQAALANESVALATALKIDSDPLVEHAHFIFENGVRGTLLRASGCSVRLCGTDGVLTVHADGAYLQLSTSNGRESRYFADQRFEHPLSPRSATTVAFEELIESIEHGSAPSIAPNEIADGLRMLLGCVWSHMHAGRMIGLEVVPPELEVTGRYGELYA